MLDIAQLLRVLRDRIDRAVVRLRIQPEGFEEWKSHLDRKIIPLAEHVSDGLVTIAICGAANVGKSTLFNTLCQTPGASTVNWRAGTTQSVVAAVHPQNEETFDHSIAPLLARDGQEGQVRRISVANLPEHLNVLDTPDFNTGAGNQYANRASASAALAASDVFIYLVTNTTYADRDNHDFIRDKLAGIGIRKSFILYSDPAQTTPIDAMAGITEEIGTRIYGSDWSRHVLGRYRVQRLSATGLGLLDPPVPIAAELPLSERLRELRPRDLHEDYLRSALLDIRGVGSALLDEAQRAFTGIEDYREAIKKACDYVLNTVDDTLLFGLALQRLVGHFEKLAPPWVQVTSKVGSVMGWPVAKLIELGRFLIGSSNTTRTAVDQNLTTIGENLCTQAARLRGSLLADSLEGVAQPPVLRACRSGLSSRDWSSVAERIRSEVRTALLIFPEEPHTAEEHALDARLMNAAKSVRDQMSKWEHTKESGLAVLRMLPAPIALAYVLLTGDLVVGAPTIWGKLQGLFGVNDLVALAVPIPSEAINKGIESHSKAQVSEALLAYRTTCMDRLRRVIERELISDFSVEIEPILSEVGVLIDESRRALAALKLEAP